LVYRLPEEVDSLAELLRQERPTHVELHHALGHQDGVRELDTRLGVPLELRLHDYALICPRVTLVDTTQRYCGEPDLPTCERCGADEGRQQKDAVAALRAQSAALLRRAARAVAPSADTARRFGRYFPDLPRATVQAWAREAPVSPRTEAPRRPNSRTRTRVCVVGAISVDKGYDVLLAAAGDAAQRRLPLEFVVVGYTCDDERLQTTGRAWVTGEFAAAEAEELIRAQAADFAWLPSIWPETWCYALSDAWQAGLNVVAFDVGAPAERIRATGRGWLLPLGMPPAALNDALLRRAGTGAADHADAPPHARGSTV
jgi:glycosyltransferase involved in cell wall biosynthesis